jgi:hypothetical protein
MSGAQSGTQTGIIQFSNGATAAVTIINGMLAIGPRQMAALNPNGDVTAVETDANSNLLVSDLNNAAYQGAVLLTPGAPAVAPLRSLGYECTASGTLTVTFPDSSTLAIPITAGSGFQSLPFAVTQVALSNGAAGQFWNLK